jgi:hypothetical protein
VDRGSHSYAIADAIINNTAFDGLTMRMWPASWNWRIVLIAALVGGVGGAIVGARRSAALLRSGAHPMNSVEALVANDSDGRVFTLLYGILGASVAMALLAPPLVVATLFQAREMAVQARLKSHNAMQQAFPGASSPASLARNAGDRSGATGSRTGSP